MKIEVVAIETSGLNPEKEIILEAAVVQYDTESGAHDGYKSSPIDPGAFDLSADILHFHGQTGLIADLLAARIPLDAAANWLKSSHLRVVWALEFARPFLAKTAMKPALTNAIDARSVLELARVLHGYDTPHVNRAIGKVSAIVGAIRLLGGAK